MFGTQILLKYLSNEWRTPKDTARHCHRYRARLPKQAAEHSPGQMRQFGARPDQNLKRDGIAGIRERKH